MSSRGYIIPIGGAEDRSEHSAVLQRFVEICGGEGCHIAIIPTASQLPDTGPTYQETFTALGADRPKSLPFLSREDAENKEWLGVLERADGVFLTGGNQLRLSTILGGTSTEALLRERNQAGLHVAGTSAGAAILSQHMIAHGKEGSTPRAGKMALAPGFGMVDEVIVDQHFRQRDRLGRLLTALSYNPRLIGLGVDEDTAAVIDPNGKVEAVGSGAVTVVDPSELAFSSIAEAARREPVTMLNARIHVLGPGATFDLETRTANLPSAEPVLAN